MSILNQQVAIVTGGNAGIGKAIALKLAAEGAELVIWGTNAQTGQATIAEIMRILPEANVTFDPVDVAQTAAVDAAMKRVLDAKGRIDILINNAGITADQLLMKMTEEEWDRVISVNLKGCFNTCRAVIRSMLKAKRGRIVNISSIVGCVGNPGQVNYAASKAGMIGLTKALAKEVAARGILVNCVAPGFIHTPMTERLNESQKEAILKQIPLGYMGQPDDIAHAVWFLVSPLAKYVTGQVLTIDGGMTM